jgi:hypothetical protein
MMTNAPDNATEVPADRRRRERTMTRAIIGGIVVVLVALVLNSVLRGSDPADERFVTDIRREHPHLSVAVASDADLLAAARRACSPDGLSGADEAWLERIDVDPAAFSDDAEVICPSR